MCKRTLHALTARTGSAKHTLVGGGIVRSDEQLCSHHHGIAMQRLLRAHCRRTSKQNPVCVGIMCDMLTRHCPFRGGIRRIPADTGHRRSVVRCHESVLLFGVKERSWKVQTKYFVARLVNGTM